VCTYAYTHLSLTPAVFFLVCRLASGKFVQVLQKISTPTAQETSRRNDGDVSGSGNGVVDKAGAECGEGVGSEATSEGDAWLKMLECIVETLPSPSDSFSVGRSGGAGGEERREAEDDGEGAAKRVASDVALACQRECGVLVEGLLQVCGLSNSDGYTVCEHSRNTHTHTPKHTHAHAHAHT